MQEILRQIAGVPCVVGSVVYRASGEVLAAEFPPVFERASLQRVASTLAEDANLPQWIAGQKGLLDLRFADGRLMVRPYPGAALAVLCTNGVNPQLLSMALVQAVRRLENAGVTKPAPAAPPVPAMPGLEIVLEGLKRALVQRIGPIGGVVYNRTHAAWTASGTPNRQGVLQLLEQLAAEIDDEADRRSFLDEGRRTIH